jgi:NHL repeat-containing protein
MPYQFTRAIGSAGTGSGQYVGACGLAVDTTGNVYVADAAGHKILKYGSAGQFIAAVGSNGSGNGQFRYPRDVAVDSAGTVYVADAQNLRIQVFSSGLAYVRQWSMKDEPCYLAFDAGGTRLYTNITPYVIAYTPSGAFVAGWQYALGGVGLSYGFGVGADGSVFLGDGNQVYKFNPAGAALLNWGGQGDLKLVGGTGVHVNGHVVVSDSAGTIREYDSNGVFVAALWGPQDTPQLIGPARDLVVDVAGEIVLINENRVLVFAPV